MKCADFIAMVRGGVDDAETRSHLRGCDACMAAGLEIDADLFFRALGGGELVPPGGIDAFAHEVMQQIHLRQSERELKASPRRIPFGLRWSAAAALLLGVGSIALWQGMSPMIHPVSPSVSTAVTATMDRPTIESYDSAGATIVELAAETSSDFLIVMVFDESLPADL
jgi:anti-sigma factor RsiW